MARRRFSRRRSSGGGFGRGIIGQVKAAVNPRRLAMSAVAAGATVYVVRKIAPEYAELAGTAAGALTAGGGLVGMGIGAAVGKFAGAPVANAAEGLEARLLQGGSAGATGGANF